MHAFAIHRAGLHQHLRPGLLSLAVLACGMPSLAVAAGHNKTAHCCPHHRAGHAENLARWARPSEDHGYRGGWVGGGAVGSAQPQRFDEGTWGWDYQGRYFPARVWLDWLHGRRDQGGAGAYSTDGPKLLDRE